MLLYVEILNADSEPRYAHVGMHSPWHVFDLAESQREKTLKNGANWSAGLVSFLASKLIEVLDNPAQANLIEPFGRSTQANRIDAAIHDFLLANWLYDSVFCGLTTDDYLNSEVHFVIAHDSRVLRSLVPLKPNSKFRWL